MALVNHLKNREAQRQTPAVASGRHNLDGLLTWSKTIGGPLPTPFNIVTRQVLGRGTWEGPESVFVKGKNIPAGDYVFQDGSQTVPNTTFFPTDTNSHTGSVLLDVKHPQNVGDADTKATTPELAAGIFKTELFPDFDASGNQVDPANGTTVVVAYADLLAGAPLDEAYFTYTASPARVLVGWLFKYGKIAYSRIHWPKWVAWKNYCASTEAVDYTSIPGFEGVGLTAKYYEGTVFNTLKLTRIDPVVQFGLSNGGPAIGVPTDNFSARWEGKVLAEHSEIVTFKIIHDNGARLWVNGVQLINQWQDDGQSPVGTHTGTIALTAGTFYTIKAEWNEGGGPGEFQLFWSSASQPEEIIPQDRLYPLATMNPRYEAHVAFTQPTTLDAMISSVLMVSNSIKQDVDGKIEFYCVEQLTSTFAFTETNNTILENGGVSTLKLYRSDVRISEVQNVFEANHRDLDSQFLEEPAIPLREVADELLASAGREIYGTVFDLFNMTRWQARKVLKYIVDRAARKDLFVEFDGTARAYQVVAGDIVTLTHSLGGVDLADKEFMVIEAQDNSPEETAETRHLKLQEW